MKKFYELIRQVAPRALRAWRRARRERKAFYQRAIVNRDRTPAQVFGEIYETNAWGGDKGTLFSGSGSSGKAAEAYIDFVNKFVADQGIKSIVDIGCGDFKIGSGLQIEEYVGVDVAPNVCRFNTDWCGSEHRKFLCLDAEGDDELPAGELCLVRQVLQHLSNAQIMSMLSKLAIYPYVLVTEHYPADKDYILPNADIMHGSDTRLTIGSGVYLDKAPFNRKVSLVLECSDSLGRGVYARGPIRTYRLLSY